MTKGGRIRYIDQSHHILSYFRQESDELRRETIGEMLEIALGLVPNRLGPLTVTSLHQPSFEEAEAIHHAASLVSDVGYSMPERAAAAAASACVRLLRAPDPLDPWALGHLAITWGGLDRIGNFLGGRLASPVGDFYRDLVKMHPTAKAKDLYRIAERETNLWESIFPCLPGWGTFKTAVSKAKKSCR